MDDCLVAWGQNASAAWQQDLLAAADCSRVRRNFSDQVLDAAWKWWIVAALIGNDYGHINPDPKATALGNQIGPKSVITYPSGGQQMNGPGFYEISGLAWSGGGAVKNVWRFLTRCRKRGNRPSSARRYCMAHVRFALGWRWDGKETVILSRCTDELGTVQPSRAQAAKYFNKPLTSNT